MESQRDQRILIIAGIIGLLIGGLSGIVGGLLVTTGRIGTLADVISNTRAERNDGVAEPDAPRVWIEEESATIDVVRRAAPAVVSIVVRKDVASISRGNYFNIDDFFEFGIPFAPRSTPEPQAEGEGEKQQVGGGSGFMVTTDGIIVTNRHVVLDGDAEYAVVLSDDREIPARVLDTDPIHDIAILKIDVDEPLPILALGDSDAIEIGETVIAIGYALSEYRNTVTKGVISGINRRVVAGNGFGESEVIFEAIQTDAAINPGNSGGPLLNLRGEVIGVNTAVSQEGQLVGFAIPINIVKQAVATVVETGHIVRPWLGVRYVMVTAQIAKREQLSVDHGALIVRGATPMDVAVAPESPAAAAGLMEDDVITAVEGQRVDEDHPLVTHIARYPSGENVTLTVVHGEKERAVEVTLGEFPE